MDKHVIANVQCLLLALRNALKQPCHWSVAWSMKLYWLLTTLQSDTASAHWRPSPVSDEHVHTCRFQSVSPGAGALVWFSCSQGWNWMRHITVISCCSNSCCQTSVKLLATFAFQQTTRAQVHWAAATQDCGLHTRRVAGGIGLLLVWIFIRLNINLSKDHHALNFQIL